MNSNFVVQDGEGVVLEVSLAAYSKTALQKVAHKFTGRCFVHLEPVVGDGARFLVRLRPKPEYADADLEALAHHFCNEILDQTLREEIARESEPVRNLILAHALSDTDFIHPELEQTDPASDPGQISRPDLAKNRLP